MASSGGALSAIDRMKADLLATVTAALFSEPNFYSLEPSGMCMCLRTLQTVSVRVSVRE